MWQSTGLATQHPVKLLGGLALGAVLLTGTALHFTLNFTDAVGGSPLVTQAQIPAVEDWRFDPPYYDDFRADAVGGSPLVTEAQIPAVEDWRVDPPYYDDFRADAVGGSPASVRMADPFVSYNAVLDQ